MCKTFNEFTFFYLTHWISQPNMKWTFTHEAAAECIILEPAALNLQSNLDMLQDYWGSLIYS